VPPKGGEALVPPLGAGFPTNMRSYNGSLLDAETSGTTLPSMLAELSD